MEQQNQQQAELVLNAGASALGTRRSASASGACRPCQQQEPGRGAAESAAA